MEIFLNLMLVIITGLILWKNVFNTNVVLYKTRLNLYKEFSKAYHRFLNLAENFYKSSVEELTQALQEGSSDRIFINKKILLINEFSTLEAVISEMELVDFSPDIIYQLIKIRQESSSICDLILANSKIKSEKKLQNAVSNLRGYSSPESRLVSLFKNELILRNFKYYRGCVCAYICRRDK